MFGVPISGFPGSLLMAAAPTPSPSTVSSDFASALPSWLLIALLAVVTLVIVATFALTMYSLSAPRSTLKNIIGRAPRRSILELIWLRRSPADQTKKQEGDQKDNQAANQTASQAEYVEPGRGPWLPPNTITPQLVRTLATSARSNKRTTRTTLAIVGFSLLGVVVVAIFGLSGQGVRDLRSQVIAAVTTLVATIAGFYFGAETARNPAPQGGIPPAPPGLGIDPNNPRFTEGQPGVYAPKLTGTPAPTVTMSGTLPQGMQLDPVTGEIKGTPAPGTAGPYSITLMAKNGIAPDAVLPLTFTVTASPPPAAPAVAPGPAPAPKAPAPEAP